VTLDPRRAEAHRGLVQARFATADERGIERALDAWAKGAPGEPFGWREYGELLLSHGDLARAEKFLLKALTYRPEDPQALAALGRLADDRGDVERAMSLYQRSLRADPEDTSVLFALGQHHLRRSKLEKDSEQEIAQARACFNSLVSVAAEEGPARAEVALAYLQAHLETEALRELNAAVGAEPDNSRWRYYRGMVELQLRRFSEATEDLGTIVAGDDNYADARAKMGLALFKLGKGDAAIAALRGGLAERPDSTQLAVVLAEVERAQGMGDEAVTFLERTVDNQDFRPELVEALADAYEGVGRLHDAITLLRKSIKAKPDATHLRFVLGAKLQRSGDFEAAVSTMRELLRTDPRNAEALNFIGYEYAERGIRLPEAEKLVGLALSIDPENGLIADSLGWVYFKEGKMKLALETLQRARRYAPDEPVISEHLGDLYDLGGDAELAMENYRLCLKMLGENPDPEVAANVRHKLEGLKARTASSAE
jgi:tetratricopeptide (TPR) repeat protein